MVLLCCREFSKQADEKLVSYARDSVLALKYSLLCDSSLFDGTLKVKFTSCETLTFTPRSAGKRNRSTSRGGGG